MWSRPTTRRSRCKSTTARESRPAGSGSISVMQTIASSSMTTRPTAVVPGPERIFKDFEGYLQADAYSAHDALFVAGKIVEVGCWMHARRKFHEARTSDSTRSHLMLAWVAGLYEVEDDAKKRRKKHPDWDEATWYDYRHDLQLKRSRPILEAIHTWLESERPKALPKSPIGEAIGYALNHWAALIRPWEAGFLEIDNGASERAIKPVALGRKNWLFAGSDEGGRTAATLMSLCATCKGTGDRPVRLSPRRARSGEHAPQQPDRGTAAGPLETGGVGRPGWPKGIVIPRTVET